MIIASEYVGSMLMHLHINMKLAVPVIYTLNGIIIWQKINRNFEKKWLSNDVHNICVHRGIKVHKWGS